MEILVQLEPMDNLWLEKRRKAYHRSLVFVFAVKSWRIYEGNIVASSIRVYCKYKRACWWPWKWVIMHFNMFWAMPTLPLLCPASKYTSNKLSGKIRYQSWFIYFRLKQFSCTNMVMSLTSCGCVLFNLLNTCLKYKDWTFICMCSIFTECSVPELHSLE